MDDIISQLLASNSSESYMTKIKNTFKHFEQIQQLIELCFKVITLHKFTWITQIGTGNASTSGILSGAIWAIKETFNVFIRQIEDIVCRPRVNVIPNFQYKGFSTQFVCIFSLKLAKAIFISIKLLRKFNFKSLH